MISKHKISDIRKLHLKKFRDAEGLFLVEGRKSVEMLLASDFRVEELFATEEAYERNRRMLGSVPVTLVTVAEMERISTLATPPELMAVARQASQTLTVPDNEPVLVLDRIADPGNMGTIIRTADWFDIRHIVCSPDCVEFYNPKTIQATMGSFAHVSVHKRPLAEFLRGESARRRVLGTFLNGEKVNEFTFRDNDIVVVGNESNGISEEVAATVTQRITIPSPVQGRDTAESLNAAIAAAVTMSIWRL